MYNRLKDETHSNGNKTETTDLSSAATSGSSYGSTSLQAESVPPSCVPWCGLVFYVMGFIGLFSSDLLREGLSEAIVTMFNQTALTDEDVVRCNFTERQCQRDSETMQNSSMKTTAWSEINKESCWQHPSTEADSRRYFRIGGPRISVPKFVNFMRVFGIRAFGRQISYIYQKLTDFGLKFRTALECRILPLNAFDFAVNISMRRPILCGRGLDLA